MKLTILKATESTTKNGEIKYQVIALGDFLNYGKIEPSTITINTDGETFKKLKSMVNKEVNIELPYPKPTYPVTYTEI